MLIANHTSRSLDSLIFTNETLIYIHHYLYWLSGISFLLIFSFFGISQAFLYIYQKITSLRFLTLRAELESIFDLTSSLSTCRFMWEIQQSNSWFVWEWKKTVKKSQARDECSYWSNLGDRNCDFSVVWTDIFRINNWSSQWVWMYKW